MSLKPNILVVDDEPDLVELYEIELSRRGYNCLTAHSGNEGIETLNTHPVDLILTDYRMPNGNGLDLFRGAQEYSEKHSKPMIPVIIVTGYVEEGVVTALLNGASAVYSKPVSFKEILEDIKILIEDFNQYATKRRNHPRKKTSLLTINLKDPHLETSFVLPVNDISIGGIQVSSNSNPLIINSSYKFSLIDEKQRFPVHDFSGTVSCIWQRNCSIDQEKEFIIGFAFDEQTRKNIIIKELLRII